MSRDTLDRLRNPDRDVDVASSRLAYGSCNQGVPRSGLKSRIAGHLLNRYIGRIQHRCSKMRQGSDLPLKKRRLGFAPTEEPTLMEDRDLSGWTLGDYVLRELNRKGGYGAVYRGE